MRSRTELVTTTFVDSEEEYSEDDDSEEDWRPSASNSNKNGKKQQKGSAAVGGDGKRGGRKRKVGGNAGGGSSAAKAKRRAAANYRESDEDEVDDETEPSEDDFDDFDDYGPGSGPGDSGGTNATAAAKKSNINLPPKKQFSEQGNSSGSATGTGNDAAAAGTLDLLVYKRDLLGDFSQNNRLCLWRKDDNNLLQKYIRVKTAPEEFLFTSSSVYSSWDDQRITDFVSLKVNSLDINNRRVRVPSINVLQKLAAELAECKLNEKNVGGDCEDADDLGDENEDEDEPNSDDTDAEESGEDDLVEKTIKNQKTTIKKKGNVKFSDQDLNDLDNESELDEDEPEEDDEEAGADEDSAEECQQPSAVK